MVTAIAAGNTVVLKPSHLCPAVAEAFAAFVKSYLDPEAVKVVTGGTPVTISLVDQRWDNLILPTYLYHLTCFYSLLLLIYLLTQVG